MSWRTDGQRVVAIGGGHGLARGLAALRRLAVAPTAIVTVADDGGSSGRLRADLGVIALGDLRMALLALARNHGLADALALRFLRGELEGHALGNLLLLALAEQAHGDVIAALDEAAGLLDCAGRVLPASTAPVHLAARVAGMEVDGQARVTRSTGRIERVWLEPEDPPACAEAMAAVRAADVVVLGPGSLFTSVVAALLVPQLATAVAETAARVVYLANVTAQPGETVGLDAQDHVAALLDHLPGARLDVVVLHDGPTDPHGGGPIGTQVAASDRVSRVIRADVVARRDDGSPGYGHDPARLADVLAGVLDLPPASPGRR